MSCKDRKEELVGAYLRLCEAGDPLKVNVSMLSRSLGISRKTFYYYFSSREDLDVLIFRRDIARLLHDHYEEDDLVYEAEPDEGFEDLPYYVRHVVEPRYIDNASFFSDLSKCFASRQHYYACLFRDTRKGGMLDYLFKLYREALREDASLVLEGCDVGDVALDHIADWITHAFLDEMAAWVMTGRPVKENQAIAPFSNIQHDILRMYAMSSGKRLGEV